MPIYHKIKSIRFEKTFMVLTIDGNDYKIRISDASTKLFKASDAIRNQYKISTSGYGIHWPQIDEDLSVDKLIKLAATPLKLIKV